MGSLVVAGLGKAYREYKHPTGRLLEWFGAAPKHSLKWILRNIDLNVQPGESIGLIGRNGAGKSTLLKLITGVTSPTEGNISLTGRVSALLELGMGFHHEFTGRQNAYMQGYLQGMGHSEIDSLIPSIAAFAEIGDYLDRPIRIYSSGMLLRLAFSIATAVRPDILIVDEALAVGDAYFQHKCFDRIRSYRISGTTLLFVSHDPGAVKSLCDRAILIDGGSIVSDGTPADVLDYYNALIATDAAHVAIQENSDISLGSRSGNGKIRIQEIDLLVDGISRRAVTSGQAVNIRVLLQGNESFEDFTLGLLIKDRLGNDVFGTNTFHLQQRLGPIMPKQRKEVAFDISSLSLGPGHYSITFAIHAASDHLAGNYDWWERAIVFQVMPAEGPHTVGVCYFPVQCVCHDIGALA